MHKFYLLFLCLLINFARLTRASPLALASALNKYDNGPDFHVLNIQTNADIEEDSDENEDDDDDLYSFIDSNEQDNSTKLGHELYIFSDNIYGYNRRLECRGVNIVSLSVVMCSTFEECEKKKSCLLDENKCRFGDRFTRGQDCQNPAPSWYESLRRVRMNEQSEGNASCFHLRLPDVGSGFVQCTSSISSLDGHLKNLTSTSKSTSIGFRSTLTTFDHFYTGHTGNDSLVSKSRQNNTDHIKLRVEVRGWHKDLNSNPNKTKGHEVALWTNEEVSLDCRVPGLIFKKDGMKIQAIRKDGSILKLDSNMETFVNWDKFLRTGLIKFRVPKDVVAFSCSAQKDASHFNSNVTELERIRQIVNVTVKDPPPELKVKLESGKFATLDLTSGASSKFKCEITGNDTFKSTVYHAIPRMGLYNTLVLSQTEELLRLQKVAQDNFVCQNLNDAGNETVGNSTVNSGDIKSRRYQFIVNLAPSKPQIYKPRNQPIELQLQDQNVVDQTLNCNFKGEPQPFVMWFKNGVEWFYTVSWNRVLLAGNGNETMDQVKIRLDSFVNETESDFDADGKLNYSCVVQNHLGVDKLDFIISRFQKVEKSVQINENEIEIHHVSPSNLRLNNDHGQKEVENKLENKLENQKSGSKLKTIVTTALLTSLILVSILAIFMFWRGKTTTFCTSSFLNAGRTAIQIPIPRIQIPTQPADSMYNTLVDDSTQQCQ